jgi:hypothetical protein
MQEALLDKYIKTVENKDMFDAIGGQSRVYFRDNYALKYGKLNPNIQEQIAEVGALVRDGHRLTGILEYRIEDGAMGWSIEPLAKGKEFHRESDGIVVVNDRENTTEAYQRYSQKINDWISRTKQLCEMPDEHFEQYIRTGNVLADSNIRYDGNIDNFMYDPESGVNFIDLQLRKKGHVLDEPYNKLQTSVSGRVQIMASPIIKGFPQIFTGDKKSMIIQQEQADEIKPLLNSFIERLIKTHEKVSQSEFTSENLSELKHMIKNDPWGTIPCVNEDTEIVNSEKEAIERLGVYMDVAKLSPPTEKVKLSKEERFENYIALLEKMMGYREQDNHLTI